MQVFQDCCNKVGIQRHQYHHAFSVEGSQLENVEAGVDRELDSLEENKTWILTPLPDGANLLRGKWVFKLKRGLDGSILRYCALQKCCNTREESVVPSRTPLFFLAVFIMEA